MKRIILLVLAGMIMGTAYSQDAEQGRWAISGGILGAANFNKLKITSGNTDNIEFERKTGWSAGAWVNFPIGDMFSIEPQLMYSRIPYLTSSTTPLLLNDGKISYISVPLMLKFHAGEKIAITAGPQLDFLGSVDDNDNLAVDEDFNSTNFSLFGGLEVFPRGKVTIFGRYVHGLSNLDGRENHTSNMEYKNSNIQVGLKLRLFGGGRKPALQATDVVVAPVIADRDGDGINDQLDKCPDVAGQAKYEGCPVPDSDADGINDELDKCPNQAGTAKYDGCPIPDSDGDGINDEQDKCPNEKGTVEREGCPVSDKDNDGIADDVDSCPDIAGIAANNGCPEVSANVSKSLGMLGQSITFGSTDAKLSTKSQTSLNSLVTLMNENPGLKIKVEGHTDNTGNADAQEELSEARAEAVKTWLVSKGISADRIETEGYGGTQPIADNSTSSGRAKNKRIEIRVDY